VELGDQNANPDSEAMNSRDDPNRIAPKMRKISINRAEFELRFASFAVTLLELELRPADN
jgi:alpha-L-arabinofuranosidase